MTTVTLREIAHALAITKRSAERRAARWTYTPDPHPGRPRRLYQLDDLPPDVKLAVLKHHALRAAAQSCAAVSPAAALPNAAALPGGADGATGISLPDETANPASLSDRERAVRDARRGVLAAVLRLQAEAGCGQQAAMITLLTSARAGKLDPTLGRQLCLARDPRGRKGIGYPSVRTLKRWLGAKDLAPRYPVQKVVVPPWAKPLVELYGQPQKPSLAYCVEALPERLPPGVPVPSYDAARRLLLKVGNVERERGRRLPRELKNLQPFVRRDPRHMNPGDCYTADGHTLDAEVQHPRHGRPFRPELTTVLDIATRKCVGWSAGLAESTWAVMDAVRHAIETHGVCALFYVDNGSGYRNAVQEDEVVGFAARVGMEITHSLPYNSQARGIEERSHRTIWVRGAKTLAAYMGEAMDAQARQKVFKLTRAHIRDAGRSPLLMPWETFMRWAAEQVAAYNARPHRGLPKIRDPQTGALRHQSPGEAWADAIDAGWAPVTVDEAHRADLFRPRKLASVARGEVRLFNHLYFSDQLEELHGERLSVGYDIHDPSRIWVYDHDGRHICTAALDGNLRAYFPQSVIDQAAEKRARAREKRLETHLEEVRQELSPSRVIDHQPAETIPVSIPAAAVPAIEPAAAAGGTGEIVPLSAAPRRPMFCSDPEKYRWLRANADAWSARDAAWLLDYTASEDYEDLADRYEFQGVAWNGDLQGRALALVRNFEAAAR